MTHKIRRLSLAIAAIAATSLGGAVAAQAAQLHATVPQGQQAVIHGEHKAGGEFVYATNLGTTKCLQATFEGTTPPTADELTLTPTLTNCQFFGQAATFDMNGCKFTLTGTDTAGVTYGNKTFGVDVTGCTAGKSIEVTTGICRLTFPQQSHIQHIVMSNTAGQTHDLTAELTMTGVTYQADGPLCPNMPTGQTLTNGTMTGKLTLQAFGSLQTILTTHNSHQYGKHTRGQAVGAMAT